MSWRLLSAAIKDHDSGAKFIVNFGLEPAEAYTHDSNILFLRGFSKVVFVENYGLS